MFILSAIVFILIFSFVILIHEWGHYKSALRNGVKVEEFWLWLPPKAKVLWKNKSWTEFTLNWIPFWGFVRMFWEDSENEKDRNKKWSFWNASLLWRMEIVLAWVFMNFMSAWVILAVLFMVWTKPLIISKEDFKKQIEIWNVVVSKEKWINILWVWKNSLSEKIWFKKWDMILEINWEKVEKFLEFKEILKKWWNVSFLIKRWNENINLTWRFKNNEKLWVQLTDRPKVLEIKKIQYWFFESIKIAFIECFRIWTSTVKAFWDVLVWFFTKFTTPDGISWPIWIAWAVWTFVSNWDLNWLFQFIVLISISLAVINVLPIPALDWWRFMFLIVEAIIRKPLNAKFEMYTNVIWYFTMISLLLFVTFKDILKMWG